MAKARRRQMRYGAPWSCGEDSITAIAPVGLLRKHLAAITSASRSGASGRTQQQQEERKKKEKQYLLPPLPCTKGASATCVLLPRCLGRSGSAREGASSGSAGEAMGNRSEEADEEREMGEEGRGLATPEQDEGRTGVRLKTRLGEKSMEASLNLALGAGLIFLYAKSAAEVKRMMELRAEMEELLKDVKEKVSGADRFDNIGPTNDNPVTHPDPPEVSSLFLEDHWFWHYRHSTNQDHESSRSMGKMEAELESELERLHLNLQCGDSMAASSHCEGKEVGHTGDLSRMDDYEEGDEENYTDEYLSSRHEKGVCPRDLERRLYHLRDLQQKQQIAELESALQSTKKSLKEKEMEIQWWRQTNHLVLNAGRNSR